MIQEIQIKTNTHNQMINITPEIAEAVKEIEEGVITIQSMHTTAAITINESADPDVQRDLLMKLDKIALDSNYKHAEGNSDAHLKVSLFGTTQQIIIENKKLALGTWQAIYLCEFDGPRQRRVLIKY